jgi:hypothetical protein
MARGVRVGSRHLRRATRTRALGCQQRADKRRFNGRWRPWQVHGASASASASTPVVTSRPPPGCCSRDALCPRRGRVVEMVSQAVSAAKRGQWRGCPEPSQPDQRFGCGRRGGFTLLVLCTYVPAPAPAPARVSIVGTEYMRSAWSPALGLSPRYWLSPVTVALRERARQLTAMPLINILHVEHVHTPYSLTSYENSYIPTHQCQANCD